MVERDTKNRISHFKKTYTRHKRQGKNPNRIDDLVEDAAAAAAAAAASCCGVIDVGRIRARVRNRYQMACRDSSSNDITTNDINVNVQAKDFVFGEDLVTMTESILPKSIGTTDNYIQTSGKICICYSFREFPGVYLYPEALDKELQLRLAYQAVTIYCELGPTTTSDSGSSNETGQSRYGSHRTNIDLLPPKPHEMLNRIEDGCERMWNLWKRDCVLSVKGVEDSSGGPPPEKKRKNDNYNNNNNNNNNHNTPANNFYRRFSKLSWATMGYHYDWTERSYDPENLSRMPDLVASVSTLFATATIGGSTTSCTKFTPSASICNYYTTKSTMGGHRDDLEHENAMNKPIVSVSLGLPGIFILGGPTKDENEDDASPHPVRAILLRPGDVLIMGGASRLNYHAMARVLPKEAALEYDQKIGYYNTMGNAMEDDQPFANLSVQDIHKEAIMDTHVPNDEREYLAEYLRNHRVNINVRQVYPDGG